jgi:hypothetical protein
LDNSFVRYWKTYASELEANRGYRVSWSHESMAAGIVRASIESIIEALNPSFSHEGLIEEADNLLFCRSPIPFRGLRVQIIGINSLANPIEGLETSEILDKCREALCLCILPNSEQSILPLKGIEDSQKLAIGTISLYPNDVDAIVRGHIAISELVEYKFLRRFIHEKPDPETQYHKDMIDEYRQTRNHYPRTCLHDLNDAINDTGDDPRSWVEHPLFSRILRTVDGRRSCLLIGPSSSGKSILSMQVARHLGLRGETTKYVNLGEVEKVLPGIVETLLFSEASRISLVIVDDLQSNVTCTRFILAVSSLAQRACIGATPTILAVTWPDFGEEAANWCENCLPLAVRPHQISNALTRQFSGKLRSEDASSLADRLGDDLLLLRLSLELSQRLNRRVGLTEVAKEVWLSRTEDGSLDGSDVRRLALVASSLGRYDISAPRGFLKEEAHVTDSVIEKCVTSRLLRKQRENLTMGHRSLCALIADWLDIQNEWQNLSRSSGPKNTTLVVLDYLRSLGSSLAVDSLRALHTRAGFKEKPKLNRIAAALVEVWTAFNAVAERVERQQQIDPLWGKTPSSVMFAIQALSELGKISLVSKSVDFLRDHWSIEDERISLKTDNLSTQSDFQQIRQTMEKEDESFRHAGNTIHMPFDEIDIERFHRTWLMGLILGAEAIVEEPRIPTVKLGQLVEKEQLPSGAFYPERVPWSTARVLLGLGACGRTVDTSESVRKAVDWLLRDIEQGGALSNGIWKSGTGSWNSALETTGLVLTALAAVGYDCSREDIDVPRNFLLSERAAWTIAGNELDGALAIQAYLETGGKWEEVAPEAQILSQWAKGESLWQRATLSSEISLTQSCRVAQIASSLVSIGWTAIRADLPAFLDALATPEAFRQELTADTLESKRTKVKSGVTDSNGLIPEDKKGTSDSVLDCLLSLANPLVLIDYSVVGAYLRFDERIRNNLKDWYSRMIKPLKDADKVHQNFLIWASPGSGKTFFIEETAASLGNSISFITLNLAADSHSDFVSKIQQVHDSQEPSLVMIDEIDSRSDEDWPYEEIFPSLDLNLKDDRSIVFVLVGSLAAGIQGMTQNMLIRRKGKDLLDRVPVAHRFEIPAATIEDRACIFATHVQQTAISRGEEVKEIEKLAIYYALTNPGLQSPRQLRDLAKAAVSRMTSGESRLRYDNLFFSADRKNQTFWVEHLHAVEKLSEIYLGLK